MPTGIRAWAAEFLSVDLSTGKRLLQTMEGTIEIDPADRSGKWLLLSMGGERPWLRGAVRSLAQPWLARQLASATATLGARLSLPIALLRRAAAEHRLDGEATECLHRQIRKGLLDLPEDDVRHLAIAAALDGDGDVESAVRRYGTASMRVLLRAHVERNVVGGSRGLLAPKLARISRELWASLAAPG